MLKYILSFSEIISKTRKKRGFSQRELAEKVGLPQSHLSKIESGKVDVRLSSLNEIMRVLGLELMIVPKQKKQLVHQLVSEEELNSFDDDVRPAYTLDEED